jgi:signal transduction histidine kinase
LLRHFGITPRLLGIVLIIMVPAVAVIALVAGRDAERALRAQAEAEARGLASMQVRLLQALPPDLPVEMLREEYFERPVKEHVAGLALYEDTGSLPLARVATAWGFGQELIPQAIDVSALRSETVQLAWHERDSVPHVQVAIPFEWRERSHVLHLELRQPNLLIAGQHATDVAVLTAFFGLLGAAALVVLLVRFSIERPIEILGTAMGQVRSLGAGRTIPVRADDIFGGLVRNFNDMTMDLKRAEQENRALMSDLRDFNRDLEQRVLAATDDLRRKNSELITTQERLLDVQQEVSRMERLASLGQLSSTLAHELATPLNVVSGHLEILQREVPGEGPARRRLETLSTQVARLSAILKEVLTAVRLPDPVASDVVLDELLDEILRFMAPMASAHDVQMATQGPRGLCVRFDRNQQQQVLLNLVTNAIEATPAGGKVSLESTPAEKNVVLRVRDSGTGIPPEALQRVFEPWFTTKEIGRGQGLGLAISREILGRNGGTISAHNNPGGGATFELSLPRSLS